MSAPLSVQAKFAFRTIISTTQSRWPGVKIQKCRQRYCRHAAYQGHAGNWGLISTPPERAFSDESIKLLERMAENVVFALDNFEHEAERKRAEERIQYLATHDALTGLPNRLMFGQLLNHAIKSAQRHQRQLAVLFIDLDRFKIINDTMGHDAGDQLLLEIAMRFKQSLRAVDVVGRLGGDEFVILIEEISDSSRSPP